MALPLTSVKKYLEVFVLFKTLHSPLISIFNVIPPPYLLLTALPMGTTFRVWEFKNFFFFLHKHLVLETITIVFLQYGYLDP